MIKLFRRIKRKTVLSALGEVTLIVVSVLIALFINNWNIDRLEKKEELAILEGIKQNILQDTIDINFNIRLYEGLIRSDSLLLEHLTQQRPYSDKMVGKIANLFFATVVLELHDEYYQKAKSKGLDIISNQQLRAETSRLYEFYYPYLLNAENESDEITDAYFRNYALKKEPLSYIQDPERESIRASISKEGYQKILANKNFHLMVDYRLGRERYLLKNRYKRVKTIALDLVQGIEQELARN